jgi:hypothetical protein
MRKLILPLLVVAACAGAVAATSGLPSGAQPAPKWLKVSTTRATATTFRIRLSWTAAGTPDSILTRATNAGSLSGHRLPGTAVRDSFVVPVPVLGSTTSGTACVQSKRRGLLSTEVCAPWTFANVDVAPPPPVIDSVRTDTTVAAFVVKPEVVNLLAGQSQQFCGFVQFGDGQVVPFPNQRTITTCGGYYTGSWPAAQRQPSAAQVAVVDALRFAVHVSGGRVIALRL